MYSPPNNNSNYHRLGAFLAHDELGMWRYVEGKFCIPKCNNDYYPQWQLWILKHQQGDWHAMKRKLKKMGVQGRQRAAGEGGGGGCS